MTRLFTIAVLVVAALFTSELSGQIKTPAASPAAKFMQTVGLTDITIQYARPGVKGRTIFAENGLVPFGKIWRTGANAATKITFSEDVTIEGQELKKGSYAILTKPGATSWDVMFYTHEGGNFGSYVEKTPDVSVSVTPQALPFSVENFFITVANLESDGAVLELIWDKTLVPVKIGLHTDKAVMSNIERVMAGPSANDYYAAGVYMYQSGKDVNRALEYVQKATSQGEPKFWQKRWEAEILYAAGKKSDAIKTAQHSMELAKAAGNNDYVKINTENIAKWKM